MSKDFHFRESNIAWTPIHEWPFTNLILNFLALACLSNVLPDVELREEDEEQDRMGSNVESVLPREAAVVIHEEKLEAVSHDTDELHHLQCGHVLLPPDVFLQDSQSNTAPILQIMWVLEFACTCTIDMKWKRPTNDQGLLSIYNLLYRAPE